MSVVDASFVGAVRNMVGIEDVQAWLEAERSAPTPDDRWDFPNEHGLLDLHELEQCLGDNWQIALDKYAVAWNQAELEVLKFSEAIVCAQPSFDAGGARTYPVRDGVCVVFPAEEFSAIFYGDDETYRYLNESWRVLYCILGTWRHAPEEQQRNAARKFLCDLVEQVMNSTDA